MGTLAVLSDSELNEEQETLLHISKVCGEHLLVVINDILGTPENTPTRIKVQIKNSKNRSIE